MYSQGCNLALSLSQCLRYRQRNPQFVLEVGFSSCLVIGRHSDELIFTYWLGMLFFRDQSPFLEMIDVSYCALDEQTLTLLLRAVRANCCLRVLKIEGNNLTGKGTFILSEFLHPFPSYVKCAVNSVTRAHTHTHTNLTSMHFFLECVALPSVHGFAVGIGCGRGTSTGSVWLLCLEISCLEQQ